MGLMLLSLLLSFLRPQISTTVLARSARKQEIFRLRFGVFGGILQISGKLYLLFPFPLNEVIFSPSCLFFPFMFIFL